MGKFSNKNPMVSSTRMEHIYRIWGPPARFRPILCMYTYIEKYRYMSSINDEYFCLHMYIYIHVSILMRYICVYKIAYTCMHKYKYMIYVLYIFICDPLIQPLFGRSNLQSQVTRPSAPRGWLTWPCFFFVYLPKRSNDTLGLWVGSGQLSSPRHPGSTPRWEGWTIPQTTPKKKLLKRYARMNFGCLGN